MAAKVSLEVDWQPFFLNHNTPAEGEDLMEHLKAKYGPGVVAQFDRPGNPLDKAASKVGITFNKNRRIIRTADSHRLVEWCKATAPQRQDGLIEALFKAYFEDGKDLSQRAELVACADASGLDGAAAGALIDSQVCRARLLDLALAAVLTLARTLIRSTCGRWRRKRGAGRGGASAACRSSSSTRRAVAGTP